MSGGLTVTPGVPPHRHPAGSISGLAAIATSGASSDITDSTAAGRSLLTAADAAAQRTALSVLSSAQVAAGYQPLDTDLTAIAALTTTSYGRSLLTGADAAATRTLLGLAAIAASGSASDLSAGTVPAARMPAHTGDVTSSAGSVALTVGAGAVTLAKMANLAANSIIGNNTGSAATPIALTAAQVRTLLALATVATSGSAADLTGTLADARLSANVALLGTANTWTAQQTLSNAIRVNNAYGMIVGADGGYIGVGAYWGGSSWNRVTANQGGAILRNTAGTLEIWTGAAATGAVDTAISGFSRKAYFDGSGNFVVDVGAVAIGSSAFLGSERLRITGGTIAASGATDVNFGGGSIDMGTALRYRGTQVIGSRKTGWSVPTGTATRTAFDTTTVTLQALAEHVKALIDDLHSTAGHGMIGT